MACVYSYHGIHEQEWAPKGCIQTHNVDRNMHARCCVVWEWQQQCAFDLACSILMTTHICIGLGAPYWGGSTHLWA